MIKLKSLINESSIYNNSKFRHWFANSKVVDRHGNPLPVYHESGTIDIDIFRPGTHFGTSEQANNHLQKVTASGGNSNRVIYSVYLKIENPWLGLDVGQSKWNSQINRAKELNHDGIIYKNTMEGEGFSYIIFKPEQVKSAIGNNGEFNPSNPNIYK